MDWLAFELIEGIRRGEEPVEDERTTVQAWDKPPDTSPERSVAPPTPPDAEATPIPIERQPQWAVEYVLRRLDATLAEMADSLAALDEIVDADNREPLPESQPEAVLFLIDGPAEYAVRQAQVETARVHLPQLREALDAWRISELTDD